MSSFKLYKFLTENEASDIPFGEVWGVARMLSDFIDLQAQWLIAHMYMTVLYPTGMLLVPT